MRNSANFPAEQRGAVLAPSREVAAVLLVLFPLLLMVHTRAAWVALATAILLLCKKGFEGPRRRPQHRVQEDASI